MNWAWKVGRAALIPVVIALAVLPTEATAVTKATAPAVKSSSTAALRFLLDARVGEAFVRVARAAKSGDSTAWNHARANPGQYLRGVGIRVPAGVTVEFTTEPLTEAPRYYCVKVWECHFPVKPFCRYVTQCYPIESL
jgi:hypothetical protein